MGAAVAVSLGAGGLFVAQAAPGPSESTIVTVTPERILDTRDPNNIGLDGPFTSAVSQKLKVTGSIPTATGTKTVVPTGATGVLLNVTPVNPTAAGFISIRPGDATGAATTSSLNFTTGVAGIVPNAVQVAVPTAGTNAGQIDITYDAYGQTGPTTDILIDVVGYMTSAGLQELVASTPRIASSYNNSDTNLTSGETIASVAITIPGSASQYVYLTGEAAIFTNDFRAAKCSGDYCNVGIEIWDADTNTRLTKDLGAFFRLNDDRDGQSLMISVLVPAAPGTHNYRLQSRLSGVVGTLILHQGRLTAMTVPLTADGQAPVVPASLAADVSDEGMSAALGE